MGNIRVTYTIRNKSGFLEEKTKTFTEMKFVMEYMKSISAKTVGKFIIEEV